MTKQQLNEAGKAIGCLNQAREHLDNAMYRMGIVQPDDKDYQRTRAFYDAICHALELV